MAFSGAKLREAREAMCDNGRKVSQEDFARLIGVSRRSPSRWETGVGEPRMASLVRISEVTGRPISFFFDEPGGRGDLNGELMAAMLDKLAEGFQSKADELRAGVSRG